MFLVVDCGAPPLIENGNIDTSSGTTFGLQITYTCQSGFVRQGLETRTCQDDGTWGGDAPTCQRKYRLEMLQVVLMLDTYQFLRRYQLWILTICGQWRLSFGPGNTVSVCSVTCL